MESWQKQLAPIIKEYKDGDTTPLNSDDVSNLCAIIKSKINLLEGNINQAEYDKQLDTSNYVFIMVGNKETIDAFNELNINELEEDEKEEFFDEHSSSYDVGKYRKDILDVDLLLAIERWGTYSFLDENEYEFLR